jgi:hypothetical protein
VLIRADASAQEVPTEIVVTTTSDASNGDTSTAAGLAANPGPDGISLREALQVTNNDPGTYLIRFDSALAGGMVSLQSELPLLSAGGVTVDGDVDGDGGPDITITPGPEAQVISGFVIASGGNRLHSLAIRGPLVNGVFFSPKETPDGIPTHVTFSDNSVDGVVMRDIQRIGIDVESVPCGQAPDHPPPCPSFNTWANTAITNNTIEAGEAGIAFFISGTGDRVEGATITDNTIVGIGDATDAGIRVGDGGNSDDVVISDVVIARNSIEHEGIGIQVIAGGGRSQSATTERVRVVNNSVHLVKEAAQFCCQGIVVQAGSDLTEFAIGPPVRYLDDNVVRDVVVRGNKVTGDLHWGIQVISGAVNGGHRDVAEDVRIIDNVIRSSMPTFGVLVGSGWNSYQTYNDRHATSNRISRIRIKGNRLTIGRGVGSRDAGGGIGASGVALVGGHHLARRNVVRAVRLRSNEIRSPYAGIRIIGGAFEGATENRVICVPMSGNRITGARRNLVVRSNTRGATGNRARVGGC